MAEEFSLAEALAGMTEAQKGGVFPEQEVTCKCVDAEYTVSKKGTRGWKYTGEILEGEQQGETVEGAAWYSTAKKGSLAFFLGQIKALGITDEMISTMTNDELAAAMIGSVFTGQITIDSGFGARGRKRNQLIALENLGEAEGEVGELGGGEDEMTFGEFVQDTSSNPVATDAVEDDGIAAAEANPPTNVTGEDVPVDISGSADEVDPLESLWEPSK